MKVSVILPTHNPDPERLARTLDSIACQTLSSDQWNLIIVDNASQPPLNCDLSRFSHARILVESQPGLSNARRAGVLAAPSKIVVFVDDDNVLAPDYLEKSVNPMHAESSLSSLGGKSIPEFESMPPSWAEGFFGLLALRDLGPEPLRASWSGQYPDCAPIGAGMVLRREALASWLADSDPSVTDRKGQSLTSGGDNDIVLHLLKSGWTVGYEPGLRLTHLIPASRLEADYLARLNEAMQASWMRVLTKHGCNEWAPIPRWTLPLRQARAWFTHRAWSGPAARIAWRGACGHFSGRAIP